MHSIFGKTSSMLSSSFLFFFLCCRCVSGAGRFCRGFTFGGVDASVEF